MRLKIIPQFGAEGDQETTIEVKGNILTVNGIECDMSSVGPWDSPLVIGCQDGVVTVIYQLDATAEKDQPIWEIDADDGVVSVPVRRIEIEQEATE